MPTNVSGLELARTLLLDEFRIVQSSADFLVMSRDARLVAIPLVDQVEKATLKAILHSAGVRAVDFGRLLDSLRRGRHRVR